MYLRMSDVSEMARCFGGCLMCRRLSGVSESVTVLLPISSFLCFH